MKRFTNRIENYVFVSDQKKAIERLAEYEDLEEQGLLLKLPCKVGDTVWCVEEYVDGFEYAGYIFMAVCGDYCVVAPRYEHCDDFKEQLFEMAEECLCGESIGLYMFHKSRVFLTKEEAKKALEEMGE